MTTEQHYSAKTPLWITFTRVLAKSAQIRAFKVEKTLPQWAATVGWQVEIIPAGHEFLLVLAPIHKNDIRMKGLETLEYRLPFHLWPQFLNAPHFFNVSPTNELIWSIGKPLPLVTPLTRLSNE